MTTADTTPDPPDTDPDPHQEERCRPVPPRISDILSILHILLAYARHLCLTLDRRSTQWGFSVFAQYFGTARLPVIRARLERGILRIMALQQVLLARKGRDLAFSGPRRRPSRPPPQPEAPPPAARPFGSARRYLDTTPNLDALPTLAELRTEFRRRQVGAIITDICRDLGVRPSLCEGRFWNALYFAIRWCNGNHYKLIQDLNRRQTEFEDELNGTPPLCWPEDTREGIHRMLGFFIGERWPVMPNPADAPPRMRLASATGPP